MNTHEEERAEWLSVEPWAGGLVLHTSKVLGDWYQIERAGVLRAEERHRTINNGYRLHLASRVVSDGYSCVEGTHREILSLAKGILSGDGAQHYRCAVEIVDGRAVFWSPRNSNGAVGVVALESAERWAQETILIVAQHP